MSHSELIEAEYQSGINDENDRCVKLLEAKAEEAKKFGMNDLYDMYIVAAETIRSRG